jgi:hypothetical protein
MRDADEQVVNERGAFGVLPQFVLDEPRSVGSRPAEVCG